MLNVSVDMTTSCEVEMATKMETKHTAAANSKFNCCTFTTTVESNWIPVMAYIAWVHFTTPICFNANWSGPSDIHINAFIVCTRDIYTGMNTNPYKRIKILFCWSCCRGHTDTHQICMLVPEFNGIDGNNYLSLKWMDEYVCLTARWDSQPIIHWTRLGKIIIIASDKFVNYFFPTIIWWNSVVSCEIKGTNSIPMEYKNDSKSFEITSNEKSLSHIHAYRIPHK